MGLQPKDETTTIVRGEKPAADMVLRLLANTRKDFAWCGDFQAPCIAMGVPLYKKAIEELAKRGVKLRYITEITGENLRSCKELQKYAELRHLDDVGINFGLNESECVAAAGAGKRKSSSSPIDEIAHSSMKSIVAQQQYLFETLWSKAVPAGQRMREIEQNMPVTRTEVLHGEKDTTVRVTRFFLNCREKMDACANSTAPSIAVSVFRDAYEDMKKRRVRTRWVTEITKENLTHCRKLMEYAQVRHVDGFNGNFGVSETEYVATTTVQESQPVPLLIYSNSREMVEQQQYIFDSFWKKAIPAEQRIREIEEGAELPQTAVLSDPQEIAAAIRKLIDGSDELVVCCRIEGLMLAESYFAESYKAALSKHRQGKHKGIRWITTVSENATALVKTFLDMGVQIRHLPALPLMNFAVTDIGFEEGISTTEGGIQLDRMLQSNERVYLDYYRQAIEILWNQAVDAREVIRDIERGMEPSQIEIIRTPKEALGRVQEMIRSARTEVSLLFSSANAFRRQAHSEGVDAIRAALQNNVRVRILIPADEAIEQALAGIKSRLPRADIRTLEKNLETRMTLVVADAHDSMLFELKDDSAASSPEAVGVTTYSASKTIGSSYNAIFESLWKQSELYEQVQAHDRLQKEFVDIAAHELRTPIQPILGTIDLLRNKLDAKATASATAEITDQQLAILERNARRLQKLSSEILDATRIESGTLKLDREVMDINAEVRSVIEDARSWIPSGTDMEIRFLPAVLDEHGNPIPLFVNIDKARMFQVISNLVRNAIKFSAEGHDAKGKGSSVIIITITTERKGGEVLVSVKDPGEGISKEMLPRLFTKFATDRERGGTGLGLFIAKSIVEAHGGSICAKNNGNDEGVKGATFSFTLPLAG